MIAHLFLYLKHPQNNLTENIMNLEYNTIRPKLTMSEYGRNIQKMVEHALAEPDREQRNKIAQAIISVMGQLNPHLRDITDFNHKLWDHLFIISDFRLDVDSPYPKPSRETLTETPEKINYPSKDIRYLHYGKNIELMIEKAVNMEEGEEKQALIEVVANLMKKFYVNFNRENVSDEIIFEQLQKLSKGKINAENIKLSHATELISRPSINNGKKKKKGMKPAGKPQKKKF